MVLTGYTPEINHEEDKEITKKSRIIRFVIAVKGQKLEITSYFIVYLYK